MSSTRGDILTQMITDITESSVFSSVFKDYSELPKNPAKLDHLKSPYLVILDTGNERADVTDSSGTRFRVQIMIAALIKSTKPENLVPDINSAITAMKNLVNAEPLTHSAVRRWQYVGSDTIEFDISKLWAHCQIETSLIYYAVAGSY